MPDPRDSVLWREELLGGTDASGNVDNGTFAMFNAINWPRTEARENSFTDLSDAYRVKLYTFLCRYRTANSKYLN